jgi:hypothetical protein
MRAMIGPAANLGWARGLHALELYHHGSSACAAKVRLALEEGRLAWNGHVVGIFRGAQFQPAFRAAIAHLSRQRARSSTGAVLDDGRG